MKPTNLIGKSGWRKFIIGSCLAFTVAATPSISHARHYDDEDKTYDARILGYPNTVQLDSGSTALTWLLLAVMGIITASVLFKDAKRSHLD